MTTTHLNTLVVLADRARANGLISFDEFPHVAEAIAAATRAIQEGQKQVEQQPENPGESTRERAKK
jgi:hypothetical protein